MVGQYNQNQMPNFSGGQPINNQAFGSPSQPYSFPTTNSMMPQSNMMDMTAYQNNQQPMQSNFSPLSATQQYLNQLNPQQAAPQSPFPGYGAPPPNALSMMPSSGQMTVRRDEGYGNGIGYDGKPIYQQTPTQQPNIQQPGLRPNLGNNSAGAFPAQQPNIQQLTGSNMVNVTTPYEIARRSGSLGEPGMPPIPVTTPFPASPTATPGGVSPFEQAKQQAKMRGTTGGILPAMGGQNTSAKAALRPTRDSLLSKYYDRYMR